jgi:hypothetical protein
MSYFKTQPGRRSMLTPDERVAEELQNFQAARSAELVNRRSFVTALAAAGVASTALSGCSGTSLPAPISTTTSSAPSVTDVLNFALNLEYFEASFYLYVSSGAGLPSSSTTGGTGTSGTVSGGAKVTFVNANVASAANQLATDEMEHVNFLRTTITAVGGTPVNMPNINLAAGGAVTSDATFLAAARRFETVGISAYAGGAQYLVSTTAGLTYAAQILDTEAQHEGFLRELCMNYGITSAAVDALDTPPPTSVPANGVGVFNTNSMGLNAVRTPSQVLQILYNTPGVTGTKAGAFFPNGLNGNIVST